MPLLPVEQIEQLAPVFKGKFGNTVAGFLRKVLSIKTLSDIYDTIDEYQGADFAGALLDKLGVNYLLGGSQRLANLPDGPFITVSNHPYGGMDGVILWFQGDGDRVPRPCRSAAPKSHRCQSEEQLEQGNNSQEHSGSP